MQVSENTVVSIHYTLKNDQGEILDSSRDQEPLSYLHGAGNIIPGLEAALAGHAEGDKFSVTVEPAEGYGERHPELIQKLARDLFPAGDIEPGMRFRADTATGPQILTVTEVSETEVTVDANHPLAGERLHFEVEVVGLRPASAEEIEHGHVHD